LTRGPREVCWQISLASWRHPKERSITIMRGLRKALALFAFAHLAVLAL
jgi:hypothetical protein